MAFVALVLYPLVWLILQPFRNLGIVLGGVLALVKRSIRGFGFDFPAD